MNKVEEFISYKAVSLLLLALLAVLGWITNEKMNDLHDLKVETSGLHRRIDVMQERYNLLARVDEAHQRRLDKLETYAFPAIAPERNR